MRVRFPVGLGLERGVQLTLRLRLAGRDTAEKRSVDSLGVRCGEEVRCKCTCFDFYIHLTVTCMSLFLEFLMTNQGIW